MTDSHHSSHPCSRRQFLAGMAAVVTAGCGASLHRPPAAQPASPARPPVLPPQPGPPHTVFSGPAASGAVALTFDDGYCTRCVGNLVAATERTGAHVTFSPNGTYAGAWDRYAARIRAMVDTGQVALINHTWSHHDPLKMSPAQLASELERNDDWIQRRFGTTSRPFYRPPFGYHNRATDDLAGSLGYTSIVLWNGSFGDSLPHPPGFLVDQMRRYARPGTIMLGHGNHPPTSEVFDQVIDVLRQRNLRTVTLPELLGVRQR